MRGIFVWFVLPVAIASAQENSLRGDLQRARSQTQRGAAPPDADTERLAQEAATAYREGRFAAAVDAYDRAAAVAFRGGATSRAFEFGLVAAEIQRGLGETADAASRFRRAALRNANDPRAAKAHHTACVEASRLLASDATIEELASYDDLLREHAESWPLSPTAPEATWRRTELLTLRGEWLELSRRAREVGPDDPRHERASELLIAAYKGRLNRGEADPSALVADATDDLIPIILGADGRWPASWSRPQRDAALVLAKIHLALRDDGAEYTAQLLRVAIRSEPKPRPAWRRQAQTLLVCASLMRGEGDDGALAEEIASPKERGRLLARTNQTLRASGPLAAAEELQTTLDALVPLEGSIASQDSAIEALLVAGRDDLALQQLAERATANPNDREAQATYARQLATSRDPADLERALHLWRTVEARTKRRAPGWFEARLARTRLSAALGRRDDARKLLRLTKLTAPDMGGAEFAGDFADLAETLQ